MSDTEKRFQLRISEDLYNKIEGWANEEYRSVNGQIVKLLAEAVAQHDRARQEKTQKNGTPRLEQAFQPV